jgi:predicted HAD superfamily Cof-like phosphohydrolase
MDQAFRDLIEFETRCGHPPTDRPPGIPDKHTQKLRGRLITEEYIELITAIDEEDIPGIADGIADLIYVCLGTAVRLGIDIVPVWRAIQSANMTKVGPGSTRQADGKLNKPPGFQHPDINGILANQRPLADVYGKAASVDSKASMDYAVLDSLVDAAMARQREQEEP